MVRPTSHVDVEKIVEVALEAGAAVMQFYTRPCGRRDKGLNDPVTEADLKAHEHIVTQLMRLDPDAPVISEEGPLPPYEQRRLWPRFWLVDPLDGTKEFLAANGEFTVNIALVEGGEPVLGVVAAPALDVVYFAAREAGAWIRRRGGASIRLTPGQDRQRVTRVVESRSHPSPELEAFVATLGPVERTRLGSSLKFCRVAEGASDVYPRFTPTMEWDVAAGDCIYRNSAPIGSQRPSPLVYNQPSFSTRSFVIDGRDFGGRH